MRTHRFEPGSLVFGVLFAGLGLVFLQGDVDLWRLNWSWFWPVVLLLAGLLVLASVRPNRDAEPVGESEGLDEQAP